MDSKKGVIRTAVLFAVFILFTVLVCKVDVRAIGPQGSSVGFAGINGLVAKMFPYSGTFYKVSKLLGYLAILVCAFFALLGLMEFFRTRTLGSVSNGILLLRALYVCLVVFYILFAKVTVNYRPVLEDGELESSYPSSHTMLAVCAFISAAVQLGRAKGSAAFKKIAKIVFWALAVIMVITRTLSGVHWFTDIVGAVLLSAALLSAYRTALDIADSKDRDERYGQG